MIEVVPAILPESFDDLGVHMMQVKGLVKRVQLDIANGTYAPSVTWPYSSDEHFAELVSEEEGWPLWRELDIELDMLIDEPEKYLDEWIRTSIVATVVHMESTQQHKEIKEKLESFNVELGWGMKPSTSNEELFELIDKSGEPHFVQVMGNDKIGYHGVELDSRVYDKIKAIRDRYEELPIAVDIGVNEKTAPRLVEAGATKIVSGSAIFGVEDIKERVNYFKNL